MLPLHVMRRADLGWTGLDWSPSIRSFAGLVWVTGGPERARTWAARILLSVPTQHTKKITYTNYNANAIVPCYATAAGWSENQDG